MSISYEEALATLTSMFSEPWTQEHLDLVLRHYEGHMENTVEAVLAHGDKDPQVLLDRLKEGKSPTDHDISMDEELARQLANEEQSRRGSSAPAAGQRQQQQQQRNSTSSTSSNNAATASTTSGWKGRGTPTTLPTDFLRIPGQPVPTSNGTPAMDEDERLARMLQDELFSQEIANNPEFAHLARGRIAGSRRTSRNAATARSQPRIGELPSRNSQQQDGQHIMENLKEMGENTKKKLQMFAASFNAKMQQTLNKNTGDSNVASTSGGAGGSSGTANERRSLLDDGGIDDFTQEEQQIEFQDMGFGAKKTM